MPAHRRNDLRHCYHTPITDPAQSAQTVDSGDVNAYLREITQQDFTAKDFRTWGGTILAAMTLNEMGLGASENEAKKNVVRAIKEVARCLGNRPVTCRKYYVHPAVLDNLPGWHAAPKFRTIS